jgi:amino acid permease
VQFAIASTWITTLNAAIWSFGVNLPLILVAFIFERKLAPFRQYKFIVVALLYGVMFVLLTLFVSWLGTSQMLPAVVFRQNFFDGLLLGLGLAVGIEAGEAIVHSLEQHSMKHHESIEKHA